jgi:drug/metabolite transporter (DMT)-like permease
MALDGESNVSEPRLVGQHSAHKRVSSSAYVLLAFASLCWSGNHVVGRAIAGHIPPLMISTIRWFVPALILWSIARPKIQQDWPIIRQHWRILLWLGATGGVLFSALQYIGLQYTSALNASILNSLVPVLIIAAGALIFRDRIAVIQLVGIATSLTGVLIVVTRGNLDALQHLNFNAGDIIIVFNMIVFAIYVVYLRLRPQIHWMSFLFVLAVVSATGTMPFAILEAASGQKYELTILTFAAILYVSIFPSVLAFAAWNRGVELIGANRSGPFLHLIPLFTALLASTFLDEKLMLFHVLSLMMILCGIWLAARRLMPPGIVASKRTITRSAARKGKR